MILTGDVGGTKVNLALFDIKKGIPRLSVERSYVSRDYPSLVCLLEHFLKETQPKLTHACLGVAGPVHEGRGVVQGIIDDMYEQFVTVVDQGRPNLDREQVVSLADGRVFTAQQALGNGLVDRIGYLDDALDLAREAARISDAHIISYRLGWWPAANIYGAATPVPSPEAASPGSLESVLQAALEQMVPEPGARFLYLWQPGG